MRIARNKEELSAALPWIQTWLHTSHKPLAFNESKICRLLYEDRLLLVVEKKGNVLTVPTEKKETNTVQGALLRYLARKHRSKRELFVVHRLDRDTSGVLVFAKTAEAADSLIAQFSAHKAQRRYFAVIRGSLESDEGTVRDNLIKDQFYNQRVTDEEDVGLTAITHYSVLHRFDDATCLDIFLETGRKNQIRIQFASRKNPILGDSRYQSQLARHPLWREKRLALHAASLVLRHPSDKQTLTFQTALPEAFQRFLHLCLSKRA